MPLYLVKQIVKKGAEPIAERMIEAPNKARAVGFIAAETISAEVCEPKDIARLTKAGLSIEEVAAK